MNISTAARVVIDSNLLISLLNESDPGHSATVELADALASGYEILAPVLYLWELDAYMRHPEKLKHHAQNSKAAIKITTYDVTSGLYARTFSTALVAIKGADRIFVSLAKDQATPLITNDRQILRNAAVLGVKALSVAEFLSTIQPTCGRSDADA